MSGGWVGLAQVRHRDMEEQNFVPSFWPGSYNGIRETGLDALEEVTGRT